jgi:hypothetical protein
VNIHDYTSFAAICADLDRLVVENQALKQQNKELLLLMVEQTGPNRPNRPKLSDREVKDIKAALAGGMRQVDLAHNYSVNPATISRTNSGVYH